MAGGYPGARQPGGRPPRRPPGGLDRRVLPLPRGGRGRALFERQGATPFTPTHGPGEIAGAGGGGHPVISPFPPPLGCRPAPAVAAALANVAGGIVVMKRGTATVSRAELRQALGLRGEP